MSITDPAVLAFISAVTGAVGGLASVLAAIAAFRAAGAARESALHARAVERRQLLRDVVAAAQNVVSDARRIDDIAKFLKSGYSDLFRFAGQSGGGRQKLCVDEVGKKQKQVAGMRESAGTYAADPGLLGNMPEPELPTLYTTLHGHHVEVQRLRITLERELESVERELQTYRENALHGQP